MKSPQFSRRGFSLLIATGALNACATASQTTAQTALAELEHSAGGKLGVSMFVPSTGRKVSHRGDERFGMASSFKLALAAIILREADQGRLMLTTQLPISRKDLVPNAPVVNANLAKGFMTIGALAEAAQTTSDNAATNILLRHIGGLATFNARILELGDRRTRIDRFEPDMNLVAPGDPRDTTTPDAMSNTVGKILTSNWLSAASKAMLADWMVATRTGLKRIRAGLPQDWKAGDKTGTTTGDGPTYPDRYNDIAAIWPPERPLTIVSAYYESPANSQAMRDQDLAVLAKVGTIASQWIMST